MLRYIKAGDVFMLALDSGQFGVGRIVSDVSLGNVAEFLDVELDTPSLEGLAIDTLDRRGRLVVLDSYTLFDKKLVGDWRIVARQDGFVPKDVQDVFFTYGVGPVRKRIDVFGREDEIAAADADKLPPYTSLRDAQVKREFFPSSQEVRGQHVEPRITSGIERQ